MLTVAVLMVLASTACGTTRGSGAADDRPSGDGTGDVIAGTPVPSAPASGDPGDPGPLSSLPQAPAEGEALGEGERYVNVPWELLGVVGGGRDVAVRYTLEGCQAPDHVGVVETDDAVTIDVTARAASGSRPCAQSAMVVDQLVRLAAPLADRSLVDAAEGRGRG